MLLQALQDILTISKRSLGMVDARGTNVPRNESQICLIPCRIYEMYKIDIIINDGIKASGELYWHMYFTVANFRYSKIHKIGKEKRIT